MLRISLPALTGFLFLMSQSGMASPNPGTDKIISISVNANGKAIIGRDTLDMDQLSAEIQERLWKGYMGTGKMYDKIIIQSANDVDTTKKNSAIAAVQKAQKNVLTELCLEKHKKLFEALSSGQQERIRKKFPVLFQQIQ
jgi:hypothetical protein